MLRMAKQQSTVAKMSYEAKQNFVWKDEIALRLFKF